MSYKSDNKKEDERNPDKDRMIQALETTLGVVTGACKKVGISRQSHYRWMQEDEEYRKAVESISDISLDFAESKLFEQIMEGNVASTIFYLKTKGKRRGYIEKAEIEHSGEIQSNTIIRWGDKEIKV